MNTFSAILLTLCVGICASWLYDEYDYDHEPEDDLCGHMMSYGGPSGVITSPSPPRSPRFLWYIHSRSVCTYTIDVGQNNSISLKFLMFSVGYHFLPCLTDWFQIGCSVNNRTFVESIRLCGLLSWKPVLKFDNCTTMRLNFTSRPHRTSFKIQYNITSKENESFVEDLPVVDCGETLFENASGGIVLPKEPGVPLAILNCTYTISSPLPSIIRLYIRKFDLLMLTNDIGNQRRNEFEIECVKSNNENQSLPYSHRWQTLSATYMPTTVYCRSLKLFIHSESYDPQESYVIPYTIQEFSQTTPAPRPTWPAWSRQWPLFPRPTSSTDNSCGKQTYTEPSGAITSPRFPLEYPHSLDCSYDIIAGGNKSVLLNFVSFDLEISRTSGCAYDYVTIHCLVNGTNIIRPYTNRRFCGEIKLSSAIRLSGCSNVILKFVADSSIAEGGFKIQYNVSESDDVSSSADLPTEIPCGDMLFTQSSGMITIPRNPTGYLARINCTYVVTANQSSTFTFNTSSTLPKLYSSFQNCRDGNITIECVDNQRVTSFCQMHSLLISPINSFSNCQILKISLQSDTFDVHETLEISFTVVTEADRCGNTSFSDDSGFISSPGYPRSYENNLNCTYTIDVGTNKSILLEFEDFHLEEYLVQDDCRHDWLMIRCLSNRTTSNPYLNTKHCQRMVPALVLHDCHAVTLQFVTDSTVVQRGFQIFYAACESSNCALNTSKLSGCGNTSFTDSSGFITSPSYPVPYLPGLNCIYTIDVAQNKTVTLDFLSFDLRNVGFYSYMHYGRGLQPHCIYDWLMIHCMSGEIELPSAYTNVKLCGQHVWQFTLHGCESVMLHFTTSTLRIGSPQGFKIFYETSEKYSDCGNTSFSGSSGIVTSPNFPGRYSHNLNCVYSIAMEQNDSVSLEFLTFDLDSGSSSSTTPRGVAINANSCANDWLMVSCIPERRVGSNQYENTRLCGSKEVPFTWTISGCMSLNLIFITDSTIAKSGFKLQYDIISPTTKVTFAREPSENSTSARPEITQYVTTPRQSSEISTSSLPQLNQSIECERKCQNNSKETPCECSTQMSSLPNPVVKGAEELKSARVSPLLLLLVLPVLVGLVFGLVFLIRRRRLSDKSHERLLENESGNTSSTDDSLAENSLFQAIRGDASVKYVPLKSMISDDREVIFS